MARPTKIGASTLEYSSATCACTAGEAAATACGVRVAASSDAGSPAATPAPISPPTMAVAVVEPTWRTRLTVAVTLPVSVRGAALCATATMMFMNDPVPMPTRPMATIGTQSGIPAGRSAITSSPTAAAMVPKIGKTRYRPVRLARDPVTRVLTSIPNTVAMGTSPDTVAVVRYAIWM